ncbi:MAG: two-component system sensor histidine kinase AtoS [Peptococcaceae bacterium]|nr:two-component system sensor histidine kinase AtoS [Peptococcaceae bacterium]MDH7525593.1 two-component system sensor histidine kinase AtoS [Peptococcaceae bacterium]
MPFNVTIRVRLIIILLFAVTLPIIIAGYFMTNQAEAALLNEKKAKLFGYARLLEKHLDGTYNDILAQKGALNKDRLTKIKILNEALREYTDEVALTHPGLGIGYYSKELDAILTYGPEKEFAHTIGQSIFPGHQGYTVMETGKEMVQIGKLVRGPIMNCMVPIIREGEIIGYIWSNELLADIEAQIGAMDKKVHETIIVGLFCALILSYFLTGTIARDVEKIKEGIKNLHKDMSYRFPPLRGEFGEIAKAINEMSEALTNMKQHTENIAASTPNGLVTLDRQGLVTIFNLAAERMTGIPAREAIDNHYRHVFHDWPEIINILDNAFRGELYQNNELSIKVNERQLPVLLTTSALLSARDEQMGILVILRDLTDTKKLEEQVRRADRLAVTGELAAGVAHEVRNPLTAITGYLQLLAIDFDHNDPRHEFTRIISKEIDRLNHLIDQLLYYSRPLPPQFLSADLNRVIEETLLLINNPAIRKNVTIKTKLTPGLPPVKIDLFQFKQVLINIILNGIQAIKDTGTVTLRTSYKPPSSFVCLQVEDTGCGIPPEHIPRLFDPFFTTKEKGTGLGLAVADKIMEIHHGYIEVESQAGKGTVFSIYLPAKAEVPNHD